MQLPWDLNIFWTCKLHQEGFISQFFDYTSLIRKKNAGFRWNTWSSLNHGHWVLKQRMFKLTSSWFLSSNSLKVKIKVPLAIYRPCFFVVIFLVESNQCLNGLCAGGNLITFLCSNAIVVRRVFTSFWCVWGHHKSLYN